MAKNGYSRDSTSSLWLNQRSEKSDLIVLLLLLIGLYEFSTSFFLNRHALPQTSHCGDAKFLYNNVLGISSTFEQREDECWIERKVDALAFIVVDALRFDFALHELPKSIGKRLSSSDDRSQLFQFVADPPTVTMQRIKGMTTGGLPTFAEFSANFGGGSMDEDSWVEQLYKARTGSKSRGKTAFVGDDTWIDLFPSSYFDEAYPFPSFNTRDLHTVDDGCLKHLPHFLKHFGKPTKDEEDYYEMIIVHFLGVDHVGHTYGPNTIQMRDKLQQMDDVLDEVLTKIDEKDGQCQVAFILGDHGMTEDGNHGGGTDEETKAALFAHFSSTCKNTASTLDGSEAGLHIQQTTFSSVHQIDLVPTLSYLLGLPIPYANLGAVIPSLLPQSHKGMEETEGAMVARALALNAAQVWQYMHTYSTTASSLPNDEMDDLKSLLDHATTVYRNAISNNEHADSIAYRKACGLYKNFLYQAITLGKRVWAQFNTSGMIRGIILLSLSLFIHIVPLLVNRHSQKQQLKMEDQQLFQTKKESGAKRHYDRNLGSIILLVIAVVFIVFHTTILTFSNSYINAESEITTYFLGIMCLMTAIHSFLSIDTTKKIRNNTLATIQWKALSLPILIIFSSRVHFILVKGHGQDPSLRVHLAHSRFVFLTSLLILAFIRTRMMSVQIKKSSVFSCKQQKQLHLTTDSLTLVFLAYSWWEKRSIDPSRNGFISCTIAIFLIFFGLLLMVFGYHERMQKAQQMSSKRRRKNEGEENFHVLILFKVMLFTITVTGPSAATSAIIFIFQSWALQNLSDVMKETKVRMRLFISFNMQEFKSTKMTKIHYIHLSNFANLSFSLIVE